MNVRRHKPPRDPSGTEVPPASAPDLRQLQAKRDVATLGYRLFPGYARASGPWNTLMVWLGVAILVAIVVVNLL